MERLDDRQSRTTVAGCLFMGLIVGTILLTAGSLMSRPDSGEEVVEGHIIAVVLVAPLWAAVTFIGLRCRGSARFQALVLALLMFVLVASSLV
ncbi:MAG: hypothetical protein ABSG53_34240, partial [Thermoguttaceae bacterium]